MTGPERPGPAWTVVEPPGTVADQLDRGLPVRREVWWHRIDEPTLVLGSAQRESEIDAEALERFGVARARRRSGGGAVLLEPSTSVWIDLVVPFGDPLWTPDVGASFRWLGEAWAAALDQLGVAGRVAEAERADRLARLACFAGVGHGEVVGGAPGVEVKIVGLSQRRTRTAARFSGVAQLHNAPERLVRLLAVDESTKAALIDRMSGPPIPALSRLGADDVRAALLARLP